MLLQTSASGAFAQNEQTATGYRGNSPYLRAYEREQAYRAAEAAKRRRRFEESVVCTFGIDRNICRRAPDRCPCLAAGACEMPECVRDESDTDLVGASRRRERSPTCGTAAWWDGTAAWWDGTAAWWDGTAAWWNGGAHSCLAFALDCGCAAPGDCAYPQCMPLPGSEVVLLRHGETATTQPATAPAAQRPDRTEVVLHRALGDSVILVRPLTAHDFRRDVCGTPSDHAACAAGLTCPCVLDELCGKDHCGAARRDAAPEARPGGETTRR